MKKDTKTKFAQLAGMMVAAMAAQGAVRNVYVPPLTRLQKASKSRAAQAERIEAAIIKRERKKKARARVWERGEAGSYKTGG